MTSTPMPQKDLLGISVRTKNEDEMSEATARIGKLWQTFYGTIHNKVLHGDTVYGVYSGYESDHTGYFDVTAAVAKGDNAADHEDVVAITLREGQYVKFSAEKAEVSAIIGLWQTVWGYFADDAQPLKRAYTTDYEVYTASGGVELYIAVK